MSLSEKYKCLKPQDSSNCPSRERHDSVEVFKRERENFRKMQSELKKDPEYQNKYVAIHGNEVVGASKDRLDLYLQMSNKFSSGSFYISKVYPPR